VERIIETKKRYQPPTPAIPRKRTEGMVAQQAQEPEREAQATSPQSSTEPGQPLPRERTEALSGSPRDLEARNEAIPTKTTGTQPKVVITRTTKEGGIKKTTKETTRAAAKKANENNNEQANIPRFDSTQTPEKPATESTSSYNPTQIGWNIVPERKSFA
jgi:hypothetical protein